MMNHSESNETVTRYSNKNKVLLESNVIQSSSKTPYLHSDPSVVMNGSRKQAYAMEMHTVNDNSATYQYSKSQSSKRSDVRECNYQRNLKQKLSGPSSLPFDYDHYANDKHKTSTLGDFHPSSAKLPRKGNDADLGKFEIFFYTISPCYIHW